MMVKMSTMNDVNIYEKIVTEETNNESCSINYENTTEYMILPKCGPIEETMVNVVGEEIVVDEAIDLQEAIDKNSKYELKETEVCLEESLDTCSNKVDDYTEICSTSSLSPTSIVRERWSHDFLNNSHSTMESDTMKNESTIDDDYDNIDDLDGDDETIATFVTATGQQLALYAVEDSEEIFAVSLYDESGEPPTNFQFLMKADVERLIGEGAVRTVKKPTQIRKQLLTTQAPVLFSKEYPIHHISHDCENKIFSEDNRIRQHQRTWEKDSILEEETDTKCSMKTSNVIYKQSNVTYLMMDNCSIDIDQSESNEEETKNDHEILEQSTVQYILFEGDQSDSELTFDEIQATLHNQKVPEQRSLSRKMNRKSIKEKEDSNRILFENVEKDNFKDADSDTIKLNRSNVSILPEVMQAGFKTKRSRKQQLISVNREDSEIIIQPASPLNEEEKSIRKRGRRKRRIMSHPGYHYKRTDPKSLMKMKHSEIEVIEIDLDEEENISPTKKNVVEITIDDNKCSSDKENEIIMVGDSDDDTRECSTKLSGTILKCEYCSRSFRQKRALDTHLRVCSKSPSDVLTLNTQKFKHINRVSKKENKKQYACKICQEKFDVVVALARHVRSEHSQRKKRTCSKSSIERNSEESFPTNTVKEDITMLKRTKKKNSQDINCAWESKRLNCNECGRWFTSTALLRTHCLQHDTQKHEQQIRRCQICKKLIKSRILFIRHLKMHSNAKLNKKSVMNILQKKLRTTRQASRKITTLRKRGRPRKL